MTDRDRKKRVKLTKEHAIYIHNDLSNAAHYYKNRISDRIADDDRDGIFHEMLAGLTMTAFAMEACVNFVGAKQLGADWNERAPYWTKVDMVLKALKIEPNFSERPYSTIDKLKTFRDGLAHGKPEKVQTEETVVGTRDEFEASFCLKGSWEEQVTPENVVNWYDDMNEIWHNMLQAAEIKVFDTMTTGASGIEFIEWVDD